MARPLRSILAATDLASGSDAIVRSAAGLARQAGADLHLLHSLELPSAPAEDVMRRSGLAAQVGEAEERLRQQVERTMPADTPIASARVVLPAAREAILDRVQEVSADLIVLGPHTGGEAAAHFLGTTADRVIRTAGIPCLVVEEPLADPVRTIGVPVDFSDPAQRALEAALAWGLQLRAGAQAEGAGSPVIRVMHVGWAVEQHDDPDMEERTIRPELERRVERAMAGLEGADALDVRFEVVWANSPTEAIAVWTSTADIDLLAVGTHGRSGLKRALIGSVASSVTRQTPRPVLLVPPASE